MTDTDDTTTASGTDDGRGDGDGQVSGDPARGGTTAAAAGESAANAGPSGTESRGSGTAAEPAEPAIDTSTSEVLYETSPTVKPLLGVMATVAVVAGAIAGFIAANPGMFGDAGFATIALNAVLLLAAIVLIRLGVRVLVLRRTTYTIRSDGFESAFSLAYKRNERTIPVGQLRGQELNRGRYQTIFNCATVSLLTGGTNASIGFVEFEYVPDPSAVQERIRNVRKAHESQH